MNLSLHNFVLLITAFCLNLPTQAIEFDEPVALFSSEEKVLFSYNTSGTAGVDSRGNLHLVYYIADESHKPPQNKIMYQAVANGQFSDPIRVDNGEKGGGRHPSLVIGRSDSVHVVWQDYRHTTALGNYIDNLEIYYGKKTVDGAFPGSDIRLTTTNAGHPGDSGYVPNIAVTQDNRLYVCWYDFTLNGNNADVYIRSSDANGEFPHVEGIEPFRITESEEDFANYTSNWLPDAEVFPDGSAYAVWGFLKGWQGAFQLQGRSVLSDGSLGDIDEIYGQGGRFIDPPRLTSDRNGNLGMVSVETVDGMERINFHYKRYGENWMKPVQVNDGTLSSSQACLAFDSSGTAHVIWQEDLSGIYQIVLASIDPQTFVIGNRTILSTEDADAQTPAVAIDPVTGQLHVIWIGISFDDVRSIVYRSEKAADVDDWVMY